MKGLDFWDEVNCLALVFVYDFGVYHGLNFSSKIVIFAKNKRYSAKIDMFDAILAEYRTFLDFFSIAINCVLENRLRMWYTLLRTVYAWLQRMKQA